MRYVRPNVRLYEALKVPEAVKVLKKYVPKVAEIPADSADANCTIFRIIKDDYPDMQKTVFAELEQISFDDK
mgnify:CR=1 FL=1